MNAKEEFIQIYKSKIQRKGSQQFLDYLTGDTSDFFYCAVQYALPRLT